MTEDNILISESSIRDTLRTILGHLLENGVVDSAFALRETRQPGRYCYSLITDPSLLSEILPFHPVMPVQGARALSDLTITESPGRPVAALLRPCEIRAFVENVKQSQGSLENIFIISCTCPGVIPASRLLEEDRSEVLGDLEENIRNACRVCTEFIPGEQADMTVLLASDKPQNGTVIYLHSEKALEIAETLDACTLETGQPRTELTTELSEARRKASQMNTPATGDGLQSLVSLFSACIGCRGCREACPLCNCILCDYETARTLHSPELVRAEAKRIGSLRVPSGTLQFQLGRLMHISPICTACGQCSDVCPVDIPVSDIFIRAANLVQESLNYSPGIDVDDTPPMATFAEKELLDITD